MGELLYLYLKENNLLDDIAKRLVVERSVRLVSRQTSNKYAYFEGVRDFEPDYRVYAICYVYIYEFDTIFHIDGKIVFSKKDAMSGTSIEEEIPDGAYGNENARTDYFNASGKETIVYSTQNSINGDEYIKKHIDYSGNARKKALKLTSNLRYLFKTEEEFSTIVCNMYNIDLNNYRKELSNRKLLDKIKSIDEQIQSLENLKRDYLNQICCGENQKTK